METVVKRVHDVCPSWVADVARCSRCDGTFIAGPWTALLPAEDEHFFVYEDEREED